MHDVPSRSPLISPRALRRPTAWASARRGDVARGGFTLIELMVIVTIIAVTALIAGPGVSRALARSRAERATLDIARLGRRARSEAMAYGRAQLLQFSTANGFGRVDLWRGNTSSCTVSDWATVTGGGCAGSIDCVDFVDASQANHGFHAVQLQGQTQRICYESDGDTFVSVGGGLVPALAGVTINVQRLEGGSSVDPARGILFPAFAAPRVIR